MRRPQVPVIADACGEALWPPNTVEAAARCLDVPVDGIEIDVRLAADGVVVLHHDDRLDPDTTRLDGHWIETPGPQIKDLSSAELAAYDVGRLRPGSPSFAAHPYRNHWDGVRIPTLKEVLDLLRAAQGPRRRLLVEIKTDPQSSHGSSEVEALCRAVAADLRAADWVEPAQIIAFDWKVLRLFQAFAPEFATAHLVIPKAYESRVRRDADGYSPWADGFDPIRFNGSLARAVAAHGGRELSIHFKDIDAVTMAAAAEAGLTVAAWDVANPADMAALLDLGVARLTVNGPVWGPF